MAGSRIDDSSKVPLLPLLHLFTLWSFAIAQPLFDLLGRHPEFFVARRIDYLELFLLVLCLSVLLPAALGGGCLVLYRVSHRMAGALQMVLFATLVGLIFLPILRSKGPLSGYWILLPAVLAGLIFVVLYTRFSPVKLLVSVLSPSVLVFPVAFLAYSPITKILVSDASPQPEVAKVESQGAGVSVVMLILDELPLFSLLDAEGKIDAKRFPNFSALAGDSTWYRYATTVGESTDRVIPAILSAAYPVSDTLPIYLDHRDNLFTLLARTHELKVFESITQLCPPELCPPRFRECFHTRMRILLEDVTIVYEHLVLPEPLAQGIPDIRQGWGQFRKQWQAVFYDEAVSSFERFLDSLESASNPNLYYYHGLLPHFPWMLLPSGKQYAGGSRSELFFHEGNWVDNDVLVAHAYQRYQLQLGFTDRQLGRLIDRLKQIGLYDRALILLLADHGFSLRPGGSRRSVDPQNFSDIMSVPLFVRYPGQTEGVVSQAPAQLVDLLPTIAEVLELSIDWPIDGVSLLAEAATRSSSKLLFRRGWSFPWIVDGRVENLLRPTLCVDGRVYSQPSKGVVGSVDSVEVLETEIKIQGKAGDAQLLRPAAGVYVFLDDQLIRRVPVDEERPEVAAYFDNPRMLHSGFSVRLERSLLRQDPPPVLRLFAWDSEGATELNYPPGFAWLPTGDSRIPGLNRPHSCGPGVSGLVLTADESAQTAQEESVRRLKRRAVESGGDLILPPVAFRELVGLGEEELEAESAEFRVEISAYGRLKSQIGQPSFDGAEVKGWVDGLDSLPKDAHLVLVFNGVVTSVLPLIEESAGESLFLGVLPEQPEGLQRLSFYVVWRDGEKARLLKPTRSSRS